MKKKVRIGLFGYGVIGHGIYDILHNNYALKTEVVRIGVKNPNKRRDLPMEHFSFDTSAILDDDSIDLIVEVISDAKAAYDIVTEALRKGKNVVTANKKMIAEHFEELVMLQKEHQASLLYEGSSCGSIPIIRTLEEYYDNELLYSVSGIFNASSNYILTKLFNDNLDFDLALKRAQDQGFVEADSTLDLVGYDALYKLIIITGHAYGLFVKPEDVLHHGIQNICRHDIQYAREKGLRIKPMATVRKVAENKVALFVLPQFVSSDDDMYNVDYEYNAVQVEAAFTDKQFFKGKGAGGHPTGSAVISDISANSYLYKYDYKKHIQQLNYQYSTDIILEVYLRYFDEKHLAHFQFEKITGRYQSYEFNYVTGFITLQTLLEQKERLNTADVLLVFTGTVLQSI